MRKMILILVCLVGCRPNQSDQRREQYLQAVDNYVTSTALAEASKQARKFEDDANKQIGPVSVSEAVTSWLDGLRKGKSASLGWVFGSEPLQLYAVQSYEIVEQSKKSCVVRIHSSTKGGQPIVRLYTVTTRGIWIVSAVPQ